ncbi:SDR family NAD(P)-dependent oxidoreductase [Thaumasiovibrio sp. DFM-14]|uniref:SDR family NAD(P)-dependent oxidoreductase n=1 Tax=Thaumasiovibrio sp. DFM-14 TaxID=3384792 RepID=UPI0039A1A073
MNISQSIIVITEAGSSLGRELVLHFAALGASVVLIDDDAINLSISFQACDSISQRCHKILLDPNKPQQIEQHFEQIHQNIGCVNALINCWHGVALPGLFDDSGVENYCKNMSQVISSRYSFTSTATQQMAKLGQPGVIINIADNIQLKPSQSISGAHSLIASITQSWSQDLIPYRIRVGGIIARRLSTLEMEAVTNELYAQLHYEMVRHAEYIIRNDTFNGRMLEAEMTI